jgi:hypothetical protein
MLTAARRALWGSAKPLGPLRRMLRKAKGGEWARALGLIGCLTLGIVEADTVTYNAATSTCGKGHKWARAL